MVMMGERGDEDKAKTMERGQGASGSDAGIWGDTWGGFDEKIC